MNRLGGVGQAARLERPSEAHDDLAQILCPMVATQHDALGERIKTDLVAARASADAAHHQYRRAQQRGHDDGAGWETRVATEKRHCHVAVPGHRAIRENADYLATLDGLARAKHAVGLAQRDDRLGQVRVQPVQQRGHSWGVAAVHQWPHRHGRTPADMTQHLEPAQMAA